MTRSSWEQRNSIVQTHAIQQNRYIVEQRNKIWSGVTRQISYYAMAQVSAEKEPSIPWLLTDGDAFLAGAAAILGGSIIG